MLGLGEFEFDGYGDNKFKDLLWIYFLLATFLTQIIFINTLIAILGSTFTRIMENRNIYALMQRAKIYYDFIHLIKPLERLKNAKYIYVIKPDEIHEDEQDRCTQNTQHRI